MEWISVKDRLPVCGPHLEWPSYDWVLVCCIREGTNEPCPWYIARYAYLGWEFINDEETMPDFSDTWATMTVNEITHWAKIKPPIV